ncbi:U3 small nucleolar RNA-associated protein 25 [Smittium culicis]|uniref:U3 small nucleolar RNA-associated protein 25 n=1 Tax=Smittium culicis TaxID=133412 RepID=A0A1R1Y4V1_9FUNG|nr:U3 small nucleolar RNA-associated protein 25 [Smittium culicis]
MLYTERFHYYYRYKIRGTSKVVFYGLPEHSQYFPEMLNLLIDYSEDSKRHKRKEKDARMGGLGDSSGGDEGGTSEYSSDEDENEEDELGRNLPISELKDHKHIAGGGSKGKKLGQCTALFTKYDYLKLERIIGTNLAVKLCESNDSVFSFNL